MNHQHSILSVIALGLSVLTATTYAADEPIPPTLDEIVVTAQKREEKLQDVPLAVTVVSAEQLTNQHVEPLPISPVLLHPSKLCRHSEGREEAAKFVVSALSRSRHPPKVQ
jgi:hypothetical protein